MAIPGTERDGEYVALIAIEDMGPLLSDHLGLQPGPLSPILGFVSDYQKKSGTLSPEGTQLGAIDLTRRALTILAHPELFFISLSGGNLMPVVQEVTCHAPGIEPDTFVSIAPAPDGSLAIQWHQSPWEFLARWLDGTASNAAETTPNLIPPPVTAEALIYILHTIDAYNRLAMQSRLDHERPGGRAFITPESFVESLRSGLSSSDTRWLLPAFLAMTPDVSTKGLGDHESALEQLEVLDFLRAAQDAAGNDVLVFGDAAIIMGEEFARLWSANAGFRIALADGKKLQPLASGFLAATGLANHLVLLTGDEQDGQPVLNHQALTRDELEDVMAPMMASALEPVTLSETVVGGAVVTPATAPAPKLAETGAGRPSPVEAACPRCGRPVTPNAAFCGHCGAPLLHSE